MREGVKRVIKMVAGVILIAIGIAGLVLPMLPGLVFIYLGLELVGLGLVMQEVMRRIKK